MIERWEITEERLEIAINNQADIDWDKTLLSGHTDSLHLFHTTFYADRLVEVLGLKPYYISLYRDQQLCLRMVGFSGPFHRPGSGWRIRMKDLVKRLLRSKRGIFFWDGQPIAFHEPLEKEYQFLSLSLNRLAQEQGLEIIKGDWPLSMQAAIGPGWSMKRWATLKLDLSPELATIYRKFKASARKAIKRAERDGITVRRMNTLDEFEDYFQFAEDACKWHKRRLVDFPKGVKSLWKYVRPSGIYETFVAEQQGEMIAGLSIWGYGKNFIEVAAFQSERSVKEKLYGPDLIKWKIINWAKRQGLELYDLAGINPEPVTEKEKNIRQFKEKWGGNYVEYLTIK